MMPTPVKIGFGLLGFNGLVGFNEFKGLLVFDGLTTETQRTRRKDFYVLSL